MKQVITFIWLISLIFATESLDREKCEELINKKAHNYGESSYKYIKKFYNEKKDAKQMIMDAVLDTHDCKAHVDERVLEEELKSHYTKFNDIIHDYSDERDGKLIKKYQNLGQNEKSFVLATLIKEYSGRSFDSKVDKTNVEEILRKIFDEFDGQCIVDSLNISSLNAFLDDDCAPGSRIDEGTKCSAECVPGKVGFDVIYKCTKRITKEGKRMILVPFKADTENYSSKPKQIKCETPMFCEADDISKMNRYFTFDGTGCFPGSKIKFGEECSAVCKNVKDRADKLVRLEYTCGTGGEWMHNTRSQHEFNMKRSGCEELEKLEKMSMVITDNDLGQPKGLAHIAFGPKSGDFLAEFMFTFFNDLKLEAITKEKVEEEIFPLINRRQFLFSIIAGDKQWPDDLLDENEHIEIHFGGDVDKCIHETLKILGWNHTFPKEFGDFMEKIFNLKDLLINSTFTEEVARANINHRTWEEVKNLVEKAHTKYLANDYSPLVQMIADPGPGCTTSDPSSNSNFVLTTALAFGCLILMN